MGLLCTYFNYKGYKNILNIKLARNQNIKHTYDKYNI